MCLGAVRLEVSPNLRCNSCVLQLFGQVGAFAGVRLVAVLGVFVCRFGGEGRIGCCCFFHLSPGVVVLEDTKVGRRALGGACDSLSSPRALARSRRDVLCRF